MHKGLLPGPASNSRGLHTAPVFPAPCTLHCTRSPLARPQRCAAAGSRACGHASGSGRACTGQETAAHGAACGLQRMRCTVGCAAEDRPAPLCGARHGQPRLRAWRCLPSTACSAARAQAADWGVSSECDGSQWGPQRRPRAGRKQACVCLAAPRAADIAAAAPGEVARVPANGGVFLSAQPGSADLPHSSSPVPDWQPGKLDGRARPDARGEGARHSGCALCWICRPLCLLHHQSASLSLAASYMQPC